MTNFVKKLQKCEEKGHSLSHFYSIDHRYTYLVCMCRSTTLFFKTVILPNIQLICLPWQPYIRLILWINLSPSPISTILITNLVCVCRSATILNIQHVNHFYYIGIVQYGNITVIKKITE